MAAIEVKVKLAVQAYVARFGDHSVSCTSGPEQAAQRLAAKIFGPLQRVSVSRSDDGRDHVVQYWRIEIDETQACRVCGCTFSNACTGGCRWVEEDLCSGCANKPEADWFRDDDITFTALLLVGEHQVPREAITGWTDEECRNAEEWALACHFKASDNDDVEVPPVPACVVPYLTEMGALREGVTREPGDEPSNA